MPFSQSCELLKCCNASAAALTCKIRTRSHALAISMLEYMADTLIFPALPWKRYTQSLGLIALVVRRMADSSLDPCAHGQAGKYPKHVGHCPR